jgi:hypothetical protein
VTRRSRRPGPLPAAATSDPLAGVERAFIDGSNLLHALARGIGGRGPGTGRGPVTESLPAPAGALVARMRAAFPPSVVVDLVFDGPAAGGIKGRLATGLRVSYSGRATADSVIDAGVAAQLDADGPAATWGILVVTDDRGLRDLVHAKGARTAGTAWLAGRMGRLGVEGPRDDTRGGAGSDARRGPGATPRRGMPNPPGPKAGTTLGHRRPPRAHGPADRDQR